jgi:protease-4
VRRRGASHEDRTPANRVSLPARGLRYAAAMTLLRRLPVVGPWIRRRRPDRVAVLRLFGPIGGGARTADWIELVRRLRESARVPAVVLDIDSPGGSATASDDMFLALERLAGAKPLVAAIRGVGASGSYLAALAARTIVVQPNAVVGSIGVISASPRLPRLLDRLGVSVSEQRGGRLKGMGAPWRDDTDEELAKEQAIVDAFYDAFVGRVAARRGMPAERARELATGEVWLGREARELGLVDEVGDLERAVDIAARAAGVPARSSVVHLRRPLLDRLAGRFGTSLAAAVSDEVERRLETRLRT